MKENVDKSRCFMFEGFERTWQVKCPFKNIPFNIGLISNWLQVHIWMVSLSKQLQATFFIVGKKKKKKKKKNGDRDIVSYKKREIVKTADCDWQTGANKKQSDRGISEDINKKKHWKQIW